MSNSNFCSDLTRVKAVMLIKPAVPAVRCTSPGRKKIKKIQHFHQPWPLQFWLKILQFRNGERRGDWPQESVQKFDCKMPRYNILYIDTEPSHLSQTFCCINSQSELFIQYNFLKIEIYSNQMLLLFSNRNISESLASKTFEVFNATQFKIRRTENLRIVLRKSFF